MTTTADSQPLQTPWGISAGRNTTVLGNVVYLTEANGVSTLFKYNPLNIIASVADVLGNTTGYTTIRTATGPLRAFRTQPAAVTNIFTTSIQEFPDYWKNFSATAHA